MLSKKDSDYSDSDAEDTVRLNTKEQQNFVNKIGKDPANVLAAIQFLYMTTDSSVAKKAIASDKLAKVSAAELIKASKKLSNILPDKQIDITTADQLVKALLGNV